MKIREFQSDVDFGEKCGRDFIYIRITFCIELLFIQFELSSWQSEAPNYFVWNIFFFTYAFFSSCYEWTFIIFSIALVWIMAVWGHHTSINQPKNVDGIVICFLEIFTWIDWIVVCLCETSAKRFKRKWCDPFFFWQWRETKNEQHLNLILDSFYLWSNIP